jgi:hypothetical protein
MYILILGRVLTSDVAAAGVARTTTESAHSPEESRRSDSPISGRPTRPRGNHSDQQARGDFQWLPVMASGSALRTLSPCLRRWRCSPGP